MHFSAFSSLSFLSWLGEKTSESVFPWHFAPAETMFFHFSHISDKTGRSISNPRPPSRHATTVIGWIEVTSSESCVGTEAELLVSGVDYESGAKADLTSQTERLFGPSGVTEGDYSAQAAAPEFIFTLECFPNSDSPTANPNEIWWDLTVGAGGVLHDCTHISVALKAI